MHYKCHKVNFGRGGLYIDSPEWIKKATNKDDKCFQYALTVAVSNGETKSHLEKVSNIKSFINKYEWEGMNHQLQIDDWKTFEKHKPTTALNISYIKEKEICPASNNSIIDSKWRKRRMALSCSKKMSALLHGTTYEKVCKTNFFCGILIPLEKDNILESN